MNGWHPVVMSELGIDTVEAVQTGWDAFRVGDVEVVPEQEIGSATGWLWVPGMDHNRVPVAVPIRATGDAVVVSSIPVPSASSGP